jgi:hypothetical protein
VRTTLLFIGDLRESLLKNECGPVQETLKYVSDSLSALARTSTSSSVL